MEDLASKTTSAPEIPNKLYFRIGEVAKLAGIKPYVLRFWETEFTGLGPKKSGTGHRLYRRKDVELVLEIKRLLYDKRFTIEGARKVLESKPKRADAKPGSERRRQGELFSATAAFYQDLRRELRSILEILSKPNGSG
jgi:DNA-binding transcriptional MerR regulator